MSESPAASILPSPGPSRLEALVFTDIVDSTGLKSRLGTLAYTEQLKRHNALFLEAIGLCPQAAVVKHTGDGFLARFPTASEAVRCLVRFQRTLEREPWPGEPLAARIGIHLGEVAVVRMAGRTDIVGNPADVCARIMSLAAGGQILVSALAAEEARRFLTGGAVRWTAHGLYRLKGVERPVEIWEVARAATRSLPAPPGKVESTASAPDATVFAHVEQRRVGFYKILERLGEGGMGEVFLAEQEQPVRRRVALKVIKAGMDTKEVIARFEAERQALAVMDHPNVAKVFDAGATPQGRPFFAMELVQGEALTTYCDRHGLTVKQRLELFIPVCEAVQHAHHKGIIHRDLKPSNVLVTIKENKPVPKVIDFGVAKAINQQLTEKTIFTQQGLLVGTPEYMSPEQAEMGALDVDTRTDVYSLGVLLYELLTGTLPFDPRTLRRAGYAEIQKFIREVEPRRPSTRVAETSRTQEVKSQDKWEQGTGNREQEDKNQNAKTSNDEGVTAAQSDPGARAPGPVADAMPDDGWARLRGALAERAPLSAADIARRRRTDSRSLVVALRGDLDWIVMKCLEKDRTRRYETPNGLALEIRRYLNHEPVLAGPPTAGYRLRKFIRRNRAGVITAGVVAVALLLATGVSVGFARSETRQRQAAERARQNERAERRRADREAAEARRQAEAAKAQSARADKQRRNAEQTADFMASMLDGVKASAALGRDTTMLREMLDGVAKRVEDGELKDSPEAELRLRWTIGEAYSDIAEGGANERAEKILLPTLELAAKEYGKKSAQAARSLANVAACLQSLGRSAEALPKHEAALEMYQRLFKGDHPDVATGLNNVAACLRSLGRPAEALPKFEASPEMYRRVLPPGHPDTLYPQVGMAHTLIDLMRFTEADPLLLDAAEQCEKSAQARQIAWPKVLDYAVKLYESWHAAEPGAVAADGTPVADKSAQWRAKLAEWQATTQPTTGKSDQAK